MGRRNVNLNAATIDGPAEGPRFHATTERCDLVLKTYEMALAGFSEQELRVLDGIVLEPPVAYRSG